MLNQAISNTTGETGDLLQTRNLEKYFPITAGVIRDRVVGWVKALDGVSLSLNRQETLGLVGESGSGKTTLAKIFLLLENPTSGEVFFEGKNLNHFEGNALKAYRRKVQAVFQDPFASLSPRMKILDIIGEPLRMAGGKNRGEIESRVTEVLKMVGLDPGLAKVFPHELSGGQRQRVAIARAVSTHSRLIILDEPTSALDVSVRLQIVHLLLDLQQEMGHSYFLIGHDLAMVAYMSTEIAVMYLGKIMELAPTKDLLKNPGHPYTRALIAASLPNHPRERKERTILSGEIANPLNVPSGCRFHPRCCQKKPVCSEHEPSLVEIGDHHFVACHY